MQTILWEIPHVQLVRLESGGYCLIVEDTNVNDFVEDFLWDEYEYDATNVSLPIGSKTAVYANYFHAGFPVERLIESLKLLDAEEVERVYRQSHRS